MRILISTAASQTLVVFPGGCTSSDPPNCVELRGGEFLSSESGTWAKNAADITTNTYFLQVDSLPGFNGTGEYGFDNIALGGLDSDGPTLTNQTVVGITDANIYLGLFGLNPSVSTFGDSGDSTNSYLRNLKTQGHIPSISWGYTAGNQYREFIHSIHSKPCKLKTQIRSQ
jgi:hypothetical protein